jgi:hypothetical protein
MATRGRPRFTTLRERRFDGVIFRRIYNFDRKAQAQSYAARARKMWGIKVRVIGHAGSWTVYKEGRWPGYEGKQLNMGLG